MATSVASDSGQLQLAQSRTVEQGLACAASAQQYPGCQPFRWHWVRHFLCVDSGPRVVQASLLGERFRPAAVDEVEGLIHAHATAFEEN